jgi:hypothetical protein
MRQAARHACHDPFAGARGAYIDAAGVGGIGKGWLFLTAQGRNGSPLSYQAMSQPDAWAGWIRRRAAVFLLVRSRGHGAPTSESENSLNSG